MKKNFFNIFLVFFLTSIFYFVNEIVYNFSTYYIKEKGCPFDLEGQIYNFIIYMCFYFIFYAITNRYLISNWIMYIFYLIITIVTCLKAAYTTAPIYLSDLDYFKYGIGNIVDLIGIEDVIFIAYHIIVPILFSLFFFVIISFSVRSMGKIKLELKTRIIVVLTSIFTLFILFNPFVFDTFINFEDWKFPEVNLYSEHGFFVGIYGCDRLEDINSPNNYDEEKIENLLNNYKSEKEVENWGTPNVIFVLSESFFDITQVEGLTFNKDIYENFNYVKDRATYFKPISPVYGGRTGNVEFEINTMSSLSFLSNFFVPFNVFYKKSTMEDYPSIASILKNDYNTSIYSPFDDGQVFNVNNIYDMFTYENINLLSSLMERANGESIFKTLRFVSDEKLLNFVKEDLENKGDEPTFTFVKTVQNHMPYTDTRYFDYENNVSLIEVEAQNVENSEKFDDISLNRVSVYAQGIYDNGIALKDLYEYIQNFEEPTIVVFFGDHLPFIPNNDGDILELSGLYTNYDFIQNNYNKYVTEALIFSNYDVNFDDVPSHLSFANLSAYVLKHLDIDKGKYSGLIDYLYDSMYVLPAFNKFITIDIEGNIKETEKLDEELYDVYNTREQIQYYLLDKYFLN